MSQHYEAGDCESISRDRACELWQSKGFRVIGNHRTPSKHVSRRHRFLFGLQVAAIFGSPTLQTLRASLSSRMLAATKRTGRGLLPVRRRGGQFAHELKMDSISRLLLQVWKPQAIIPMVAEKPCMQ
jgi:hypothetical protein